MHLHHALDFVRIDVEARHQDHVLLAVGDSHETPGVHVADVAGEQPSVADHLVGFFLALPVALHHLRTADADLAGGFFDLALAVPQRQFDKVIVANADLGRREGQADGAVPGRAKGVGGGARRRLGQSVGFGQVLAGHLLPLVRYRLLHRGAAADHHLERGKIELRETGRVEQAVEQRIDPGQHRPLPLFQLLDEAGQVARIGDQYVERSPLHEGQHRIEAEDVIQRQG